MLRRYLSLIPIGEMPQPFPGFTLVMLSSKTFGKVVEQHRPQCTVGYWWIKTHLNGTLQFLATLPGHVVIFPAPIPAPSTSDYGNEVKHRTHRPISGHKITALLTGGGVYCPHCNNFNAKPRFTGVQKCQISWCGRSFEVVSRDQWDEWRYELG